MEQKISIRDQKNALRRIYSSKRASIDDAYHVEASSAIADFFRSSDFYKNAETVLLYLSINREVRTRRLFEEILRDGKRVALPECFDNGRMTFRYVSGKDCLVKGKFSAPEPSSDCEEYTGDTPTVCVIPAIAFDKSGYRLGYGKGYYDRYLSKFNVVRVGFSFDELFVDTLPHGKYDAACDVVITEKGVFYTSEKE